MVNVFTFCLYGPPCAKYYTGLAENILLINKYFPDWKTFVYVGIDVPDYFIQSLRQYPNVVVYETGLDGIANMVSRFCAIDDPAVDIMMVRDADSRVHWKDRWAIRQFLESPTAIAHTIRDHKEHTAPMMGGLWGIRKSANIRMGKEYDLYRQNAVVRGWAHDQDFLAERIYPLVQWRMLVHYSNDRGRMNEICVEFPFDWTDGIYCGKVETGGFTEVVPSESRGIVFPRSYVKLSR